MSHQFLPVTDRNTQRNFDDASRLLNDLPAQGVLGSRWKFVQGADGVTCTLQYFDGTNWTVKATWNA